MPREGIAIALRSTVVRLFRRRRDDPASDALRSSFDPVASEVAAAQRSLLAAVPTSRDPGVPLGQALSAFGAHLSAARAALERWEAPADSIQRAACAESLERARSEADALRLDEGPLDFERLNARIGDVLHHLEEIGDIERALRRR